MDAKIKELLTRLSFFAEDGMADKPIVEIAKQADALLSELVKREATQTARMAKLETELARIKRLAECGTVQTWLSLPDEDKAKWFAITAMRDSYQCKQIAELEAQQPAVTGTITDAQIEAHTVAAGHCPPSSKVILVSSLRRLMARNEACLQQPADGVVLEPVEGDLLPAIGEEVLIHLARSDKWVPHRVVGYYAWGDHGGNDSLHRVFVRVVDADGYPNARLLKDVRRAALAAHKAQEGGR